VIRPYLADISDINIRPERGDVVFGGRGATVCEFACEYRPRRPEESVLYGVVAGHLETFLGWQRERSRLVPRFAERELRFFLDCGVLARGFLRVHCDACGQDRLVPYSCKCRGFCPSCCGRRMADTAAHLVDRVFPEVPVRQWVLSVPFALRYRLAYDSSLVRDVLQIFVRAVFASIRRRAGIPASNRKARCGSRHLHSPLQRRLESRSALSNAGFGRHLC
jgi:Transposase zinc-binding domain